MLGLLTMPSTMQTNPNARTALCSLPMLLLVAVASLDSADKQLLSSSFPALESTLHLDVKTLGYFSLFSDLSYALSVPFWGYLVHQHGLRNVFLLLSISCASWGMATVGIALLKNSVPGQAIMRSLNGWMLGSILPLSQTLLVELAPDTMRGRAFGMMTVMEKIAGTAATTSAVYYDRHWEYPYYFLGVVSMIMSYLVYRYLNPNDNNITPYLQVYHPSPKTDQVNRLSLRQIVHRIAKMPAFRCLVAQGVCGGTPWSMMSFQLLLLNWRGFTKDQLVFLQFTSGLAGTLGGGMGGWLGDNAAFHLGGSRGRIMVALLSIVGGIPIYGMFLFSTDYTQSLFWINVFHVLASWTPAAAIRPICADLTRNPSERAQIVAMWIVLEKASGAILGAPLIGLLTSHMLESQHNTMDTSINHSDNEKATALAIQLFFWSSLFWTICAFFWVLMARSIKSNKRKKELQMEHV